MTPARKRAANAGPRSSERACGAVGSALPWHGRGRRFEPDQVHQFPSGEKSALAVTMLCPRHRCVPSPTLTILSRPFSLLVTFLLFCSQLWAVDTPKGVSLKWEPIQLVNG